MTPGARARLGWLVVLFGLLAAVVVPFVAFEGSVRAVAVAALERPAARWLTASVLAALLALDVLLPVPSSFVATGAGTLLGFWGGTLATFAGMTGGALLGYAVGASAGRSGLGRALDARELGRADAAARRWGALALVVTRPVPVLAEASVLLAGATRMPRAQFAAAVSLANLGVAAGYAAVGAFAARVDAFVVAFAGAVTLPGLALGLVRALGQRQSEKASS